MKIEDSASPPILQAARTLRGNSVFHRISSMHRALFGGGSGEATEKDAPARPGAIGDLIDATEKALDIERQTHALLDEMFERMGLNTEENYKNG